MKSFIISFLLIFCLNGALFSQLHIDVDTVYAAIEELDEDVAAHSNFYNDIPQVKTYRWIRNVIEITDGWESAVCDDNQCYLPGVDSIEITLGPLESSVLDVHLYPNGIYEGYAMIEVTVKDVNNPSMTDKAVYVFDSNLTSATHELENDAFKIYPNPASDYFSIRGDGPQIHSLTIHDISGRLLRSFKYENGPTFDISALEPGSYVLRLIDEKNQLRAVKTIQKL